MKSIQVESFQRHPTDCGSSEVQIAKCSQRIHQITLHLKSNPKDLHCLRGLRKIISKRNRLLKYLQREDSVRHQTLVDALKSA